MWRSPLHLNTGTQAFWQKELLKRAIEAEAEVDALILRIACEFAHLSPAQEWPILLFRDE
jgi:hypothetical protein